MILISHIDFANVHSFKCLVVTYVGARGVLQLVQENAMMADCKLYTTLISSCAKSGKVDAMFEVY